MRIHSLMPWFILTFFLSGLSLFGGEVTEVALDFFQKIAAEPTSLEVDGDLALSPFCGPEKRKLIQTRWAERGAWLRDGGFKLSPMLEKVDGEIAAVLLGASNLENPELSLVIALGLVKVENAWRVSPLEGCFDNSGRGFQAVMRSRVQALERWMVEKKLKGSLELRAAEQRRFRQRMKGLVAEEKLRLEDPEEVLIEFLKAAQAGEAEQLLVWQGILEREQLPDRDWERDIRATRLGVKSVDLDSAWHVLRSNKVMKVIVEGQGDREDANYLVSFLSSFRADPLRETLHPVRFQMRMTDQGWRIKLPAFLAYDHDELAVHREAFDESFEWEDRRSASEMAYVFEAENEAIRAEDASQVLKGVVADLREGNLDRFLCRHYREAERFEENGEGGQKGEGELGEGELELDPEKIGERRMERYREALTWWGEALGRKETAEVNLWKTYQEGDLFLGVFEVGADESGWKPKLLEIWLTRDDEGWLLLPGMGTPLDHSVAASLSGQVRKITAQFKAEREKFRVKFIAGFLDEFQLDHPAGAAVGEVEGLKFIENWMQVARDGSVADLLKISAVLKRPEDGEGFMRGLGYLRLAAGSPQGVKRILGSRSDGRFRAFSVMLNTRAEREPLLALLMVAPTRGGYALLVDVEFPFETNRGLEVLNDGRAVELAKRVSKQDWKTISSLRKWHQGVAELAWEQWKLRKNLEKK